MRLRRLTSSMILALAVAVCAACGPSESGLEQESAAALGGAWGALDGAERFAVLSVTALRGRSARGLGRLSVRGAFIEREGVEREAALGLAGIRAVPREQEIDTCVVVYDASAGVEAGTLSIGDAGWVDLIDAGDVEFSVDGRVSALDVQYLPDVVANASGLVYSATAVAPRRRGPRRLDSTLRFAGTGSGEVGGFAVELSLPTPVRVYSVGGERPSEGYVSTEAVGALDVRWDRGEADGEPLVLELTRRSFHSSDTVRCVVVDDGRFTISAELRAALREHDGSSTDRLTARRTAHSRFLANGLDEGWAVFVSEDYVLFQ